MKAVSFRSELTTLIHDLGEYHENPDLRSMKTRDELRKEHTELAALISQRIGRLRPFLYRFRSAQAWFIQAAGHVWDSLDHLTLNDLRGGHSKTMFIQLGNQILGEASLLPDDFEIPSDPKLPIGPSPAGLLGDIHVYLTHLVPELEKARVLYKDGHYDESVREAWFSLRDVLRQKTGLTEDGVDLVNRAFGRTPFLMIGDPTTESGRNEQDGLAFLLRGFATGVRNPAIHETRQEGPQATFEFLVTASMLHHRLAECRITPENPNGAN